jgi:hypothetical protein
MRPKFENARLILQLIERGKLARVSEKENDLNLPLKQ